MKYIFCDRDGVLNHNEHKDNHYVDRIEDFELFDYAEAAIKLLSDNDIKVIVVTNQAGIDKGRTRIEEFKKMCDELFKIGIFEVRVCPHNYKEVKCECRKPGTQMLEDAMLVYDIDPDDIYMIGDYISDIEAGKNFGCKTILVLSGRITEDDLPIEPVPDYILDNFYKAAKFIVEEKNASN